MFYQKRRLILRLVITGITFAFLVIWDKLITIHLDLKSPDKQTLPYQRNKAVIFQDDYIIINQNNSTKVFSSHCTHLGCKINRQEDDRLVCPCHGSEYNLYGKVLKGPAFKNLKPHSFSFSEDGKNIIING